MKGSFGEQPLGHSEKLLIEACSRLDRTSAAVRSLRAVVKEQAVEIQKIAEHNMLLLAKLEQYEATAKAVVPVNHASPS